MFLVVFGSNLPSFAKPNLEHHEFVIGGATNCHVYVDPGAVSLMRSQDNVSISDLTLTSETLATISLADGVFQFYKPLMYGLPIYYYESNGILAVSSHLELLREIGLGFELDAAGLPEFFVFRYVCPPRTLLQDICCIPLDCKLNGSIDSNKCFVTELAWTRRFSSGGTSGGFESGVEMTAAALTSSVTSLDTHSESVGCLLSGGVDSSILFQVARSHLGTHASHSTGYPFAREAENGERLYAESAANMLDADHTYHEFTNRSFLHSIVDAIAQAEMPLIHLQSALLCELFATRLPRSDKIILNGQGADGLYGLNIMFNYHHYRYMIRKPLAPLLGIASMVFSDSFMPFRKFSAWARRSWSTAFDDPNSGLWMLGVFGDMEWVNSHFGKSFEDVFRKRFEVSGAIQIVTRE